MRSGDYERRLRDATAEIADLRTRLASTESAVAELTRERDRLRELRDADTAKLSAEKSSLRSHFARAREALEVLANLAPTLATVAEGRAYCDLVRTRAAAALAASSPGTARCETWCGGPSSLVPRLSG